MNCRYRNVVCPKKPFHEQKRTTLKCHKRNISWKKVVRSEFKVFIEWFEKTYDVAIVSKKNPRRGGT